MSAVASAPSFVTSVTPATTTIPLTLILNAGKPVTSLSQLNAAILAADSMAAGTGAMRIVLGADLSLKSALWAINLKSGNTLDIAGGNHVLDGGGSQRGLFVYSGTVTLENVTLQNMSAVGASGANGGAGGAGLGGALLIANDAAHGAAPGNVTLTNVNFTGDAALGGGGSTIAGAFGPGPFGAGGGGGGGSCGGGGGIGGGTGASNGGAGGFGGGGGNGAAGGFGGGGIGGGGLGAGGDIFVQQGGSLTIIGGSVGAGGASGGSAAGQGYGGGIFLQGNQSVTLAPASGQTETISGVIADMTGSHDASAQTGAGALVMNGAGTLVLSAANNFTGGITLSSGTLDLAVAGAGGSGAVTFAGLANLALNSPGSFTNAIGGLALGDTIDLLGTAATSIRITSTNQLVVINKAATVATLQLASNPNLDYRLASDGKGGTNIVISATGLSQSAPATLYLFAGTTQVLSGLSITDPLAISGQLFTVKLYDTSGLLSATPAVSGIVSGNGTTKLLLTGSLAAVQSELASVTYTPVAGASSDTLSLTTLDGLGASFTTKSTVKIGQLVPVSWKAAASGTWSAAAAWSTGKVPPSGFADVTIAAAGATPYKVTLASSLTVAIHSLTLNQANATLALAGTLSASVGIAVNAGPSRFPASRSPVRLPSQPARRCRDMARSPARSPTAG